MAKKKQKFRSVKYSKTRIQIADLRAVIEMAEAHISSASLILKRAKKQMTRIQIDCPKNKFV